MIKKLLKWLLTLFSVLLVFFLMLSIWIAFFVDINQYKDEISQFVAQQAGLKLELKGDLHLSLISGVKFKAENIKLFNDKELIADIESLRLGLSAYSLYIGEPEITSVDLSVRSLTMIRDKKGHYNFLPLYEPEDNKSDNHSLENKSTDKLLINSLAIKNIHLKMDQFQYSDKVNAVSISLNKSEAELSLLPIIDHYDLVIDDPRVLVAYTYSGALNIKKVLLNHYQISDLEMEFNDKKGDFIAKKLNFSFLEEGKQHALPPIVFAASGHTALKLRYQTAEGYSEPLWRKPEIVKIDQFDFNLENFKLRNAQYQIETEKIHFLFDDIGIFSDSHYLLNELTIKTLRAQSKKLIFSSKTQGQYDFKQFAVKLSNVPVIHKSKALEPLSAAFVRLFAKKGHIKVTSQSLQHKAETIEHIDINVKGSIKQIDLLMSASVFNSAVNIDGFLRQPQKKTNNNLQWQLTANAKQLNLKPIAALINTPVDVEGVISVESHLSGSYNKSDFKFSRGKIHSLAESIVLRGISINKILDDFENSQSVGLLDIGAVVLLGPGGILLTKGNNYNTLVNSLKNKGDSKINQLNVDIDLVDDIITMTDMAFATEKHRLAFKGSINSQKNTFVNFEVATVNKHGCAIYKEEVLGSLDAPKIKQVNFLVKSVINPVGSLLDIVTDPMDIKCRKAFYNGVVKAPVVDAKLKKMLKNPIK